MYKIWHYIECPDKVSNTQYVLQIIEEGWNQEQLNQQCYLIKPKLAKFVAIYAPFPLIYNVEC